MSRKYIHIEGMRFDRPGVDAHYGEDADEVWAKGEAEAEADERKRATRRAIAKEVGDVETILGSVADLAQFGLAGIMIDIAAAKGAKTFLEYRKRKVAIMNRVAGTDVEAVAEAFVAGVEAGTIKLTAGVKGAQAALDEALERATRTAAVIERSAPRSSKKAVRRARR